MNTVKLNFRILCRNKCYRFLTYHKHLSTLNNFRKNVISSKDEARRLLVLENIHHEPKFKSVIGNVTKEFLSKRLETKVYNAWSWSYHRRNFFLIQLKSELEVKRFIETCGFNLHSFPVRSRMVETSINLSESNNSEIDSQSIPHYEFISNFQRKMLSCEQMRKDFSTSEQLVQHLVSINSLSDFDIQLRYFLITQLEDLLCKGIFSGFNIFPFGSSLAGLGDNTSDLDIVLLHRNLLHSMKVNYSMPEVKSDRDQTQQSLSLIADISRHYIPNFSQINRILRARVPIVKMTFDLAPIDLDVSIELSEESAHHGFIMANYISYCLNVNPIIKPFFVLLKLWAKQHGLVKSIAGTWFTNFQIITLSMFYLQSRKLIQPIEMYEKPDPKELSMNGSTDLPKLLYGFFEFLISFNFEKEAISILHGSKFNKPDYSPLYLENPIERNLNICKNINGVEFKKLLLTAYNSLDAMHCETFHLADLLDVDYFKKLEKQISQN
ncbi:hypothetical protein RDWZM_002958 [Blomia tropicalis]|uniref:Poly(A) RNA polymerase mitochondrial-like central palm domain-containing protein n=1 Tax=Blomia tropicalis TaxID=40697 RepID=A0A9Q0MFX3_BLOTA|nr:hypothetical protein BLOT_001068 [Blomia tropicalis]KAJ6224413.1 hypothetical protein RDWZM_002958 [Blomia tropicalis]